MKKLWITIILVGVVLGSGLGATWWKLTEEKRVAYYLTEKLGGTASLYNIKRVVTGPMFPGWFEKDFIEILELKYHNTAITDKDLEQINSLNSLTYLFLYEAENITDKGLKNLNSLTSLVSLNLNGTNVTKQGIIDLQKALPKCKIYGPK